MGLVVVVCAAAALLAPGPLTVQVERLQGVLEVSFTLHEPLPRAFEDALPSGAQVRVVYPVRIRSDRRWLWDRRVWRGEVGAAVVFDPLTGRYRCEVVLDGAVIASREVDTAPEARAWLTQPPPVRLVLPAVRNEDRLQVTVRAVFSSTTTWLIFPSSEGTDWVEVAVGEAP